MTFATLDARSVAELHEVARTLGVPTAERRRRDLIYDILEAQAARAASSATEATPPAAVPERRRPPRPRHPIAASWPAYMQGFDPQAVTLQGLVRKTGVLELMPDGYGFLRSAEYGYQPSPDDTYVSPSQIKRFALRVGDTVDGQLRPPKEGERFFALLRVNAINGRAPETFDERASFDFLTPAYPDERLALETTPGAIEARVVDLVAPIGKGQRGLVVAPPRSGSTALLQALARALAANHPAATLLVVLVDESPEEITEFERAVPAAEIVATAFDAAPERQVHVAELVLEKARRLVEAGQDVIVLLDSLTNLVRAYDSLPPPADAPARAAGSLDPAALRHAKRFFGAARAVEEGGSLTVVATLREGTGRALDEAVAEAFRGTGTMELVLHRDLAARHLFPAVDLSASGTRREESLVSPERLAQTRRLRRRLAAMAPADALAHLLDRIDATPTNDALLADAP